MQFKSTNLNSIVVDKSQCVILDLNFSSDLIVADQKELLVSHNGQDDPTCGEKTPCNTIGYTLVYRAKSNDIIKIDNQHSSEERLFIINETYPFKLNLTLVGINGRPIISSDNSSGQILFTKEKSSPISFVTLFVINIWFKGLALANFIEAPNYTFLKVSKCSYTFSEHPQHRKLSPAFIKSSKLSANASPIIIINLKEVRMARFLTAMDLTGLHVNIAIDDSYFKYHSSHYICSTVLSLRKLQSVNVKISNTTFNNLLSILIVRDTFADKPYVPLIEASNNVIVNNSIFSGNLENCSTGISNSYAIGATFVFENTLITSDMFIFYSNMTFKNCTFGSQEAVPEAPYQIHLLEVQSANFYNSNILNNMYFPDSVLSLKLAYGKNAMFYNCSFTNNFPNGAAAVTVAYGRATFKNCNFENNSVVKLGDTFYGSGAVLISDSKSKFERCYFSNNSGASGGAVQFIGSLSDITFDTCHFTNNSAFSATNTYPGQEGGEGGAINIGMFYDRPAVIRISDCLFKRNKAIVRGGAISHTSGGRILIQNTSFMTSTDYGGQLYAGGDAVFSSSTVILQDVIINDVDTSSRQNSLFVSSELYVQGSGSAKCFFGKQIAFYGHLQTSKWSQPIFQMVSVLCSPCPQDTYNLSFSSIALVEHQSTNIICSKCPFGGICENGQIHAAENFWGYKTSNDKIVFISCPFGYCCSGSTCTEYDSCQSGREGILCGSCRKGYTENILTPECLEDTTCKHPWLWLAMGLFGFAYFLVFMYWREVTHVMNKFLVPKGLRLYFKRTPIPENQEPLLRNQSQEPTEPPQETDCVMVSESQSIQTQKSDSQSTTMIVPGLFAIVLNFYQTNVLYKVYTMPEKSQSFLQITEEMLATVFNLQAEGLFYQDLSWCPFKNLKPISKVFLKMSFIVYLICLVLMTYITSEVWKLLQKRKNDSKPIGSRLLPCGLRLILVGYATITSGLFSLVSCVPFHSTQRILFIDGSIECYQPWQYFMMFIISCWIISFPIALYCSSWLLHRRKMSNKMFLYLLIFPLGAILYWVYIQLHVYTKSEADKSLSERPEYLDGSSADDISEELLNIIEGPFRKSQCSDRNNNFKLPWQSVLIGKRLVLIAIKMFVTNIVTRLYVMLLFTAIFLVHHILVQPFYTKLLNHIETSSLFMLTAICALNILPAFIYMFPYTVSPLLKTVLSTFVNIETALALIFPLILGCCLSVLLFGQIFHLLAWIGHALVRLILLCTKLKSSWFAKPALFVDKGSQRD